MQALQVIKVALDMPATLAGKLLVFDALDTTFRTIKLRPRNERCCAVCGDDPTISGLIDYEQFCGAKANDKDPQLRVLRASERIAAQDFAEMAKAREDDYVLIDVRSPEEYDICRLEGSINVPFADMDKASSLDRLKADMAKNDTRNGLFYSFSTCF